MGIAEKTSSINEHLYQSLRNDILHFRHKPGDKLSENNIAAEYGVSRSPVSKVFQRLESEEFVDILPQRGTFVTKLDLSYIMSMIYMRFCVECDIMGTFLHERNIPVFEMLEENLLHQKQLIDSDIDNWDRFNELDNEFHKICYYMHHKQPLWHIVQSNVQYTRFRMLYLKAERLPSKTYHEHQELLMLMKTGSPESLRSALHNHLYDDLRSIEETIKNRYEDYFC